MDFFDIGGVAFLYFYSKFDSFIVLIVFKIYVKIGMFYLYYSFLYLIVFFYVFIIFNMIFSTFLPVFIYLIHKNGIKQISQE